MQIALLLELWIEELLQQKVYAVEFAFRITRLDEFLHSRLGSAPAHPDAVEERCLACLRALQEVIGQLRQFAETAQLRHLEDALVGCRAQGYQAEELRALLRERQQGWAWLSLHPDLSLEPAWAQGFAAQVTRFRGETRATLRCPRCGWELSFTRETDSAEQMELPFSELQCPICETTTSGGPLLDENLRSESDP